MKWAVANRTYINLQARDYIDILDYQTIVQSVVDMIECLDNAEDDARDDTGGDPIPVSMYTSKEGKGRPRLEIDRNWLMYALQVQTMADIAKELGCNPRTVRRRILEYGLADPAPAIIQEVVRDDGTIAWEWRPRGPTMSALNEDPDGLDVVIQEVLERFSTYGIEYLRGTVMSMGHQASRDNIRASYRRVAGVRTHRQ